MSSPVTVELLRETEEYLHATVTSNVALDFQTAETAVVPVGTRPTVWTPATWATVATTVPDPRPDDPTNVHSTRRLQVGMIGTGPLDLPEGRYRVFVRLVDVSERPARSAGYLVIE